MISLKAAAIAFSLIFATPLYATEGPQCYNIEWVQEQAKQAKLPEAKLMTAEELIQFRAALIAVVGQDVLEPVTVAVYTIDLPDGGILALEFDAAGCIVHVQGQAMIWPIPAEYWERMKAVKA